MAPLEFHRCRRISVLLVTAAILCALALALHDPRLGFPSVTGNSFDFDLAFLVPWILGCVSCACLVSPHADVERTAARSLVVPRLIHLTVIVAAVVGSSAVAAVLSEERSCPAQARNGLLFVGLAVVLTYLFGVQASVLTVGLSLPVVGYLGMASDASPRAWALPLLPAHDVTALATTLALLVSAVLASACWAPAERGLLS